jgi:hypothetical protein
MFCFCGAYKELNEHNRIVFSDECSICFENTYSKINNVNSLKCGHVFHEDCIRKWKYIKASCPVCRCSLLEIKHSALANNDTLTENLESIQPILLTILQKPKKVFGVVKTASYELENTNTENIIWISYKNESYKIIVNKVDLSRNSNKGCWSWIFEHPPILSKVYVTFHTGMNVVFNYNVRIF